MPFFHEIPFGFAITRLARWPFMPKTPCNWLSSFPVTSANISLAALLLRLLLLFISLLKTKPSSLEDKLSKVLNEIWFLSGASMLMTFALSMGRVYT